MSAKSNNGLEFFFADPHLEDVGALVDDNLFERDILIAMKKLASSSNISERIQGNLPNFMSSWSNIIYLFIYLFIYLATYILQSEERKQIMTSIQDYISLLNIIT